MSYPYDPRNYLTDRLDAGMRRIYELIWKLRVVAWSVLWTGSGWRPGSVEHASGSAIDAMMASGVGKEPTAEQRAAGYRLLSWLTKNRVALKLQGVIWDGNIYGYSDPSWRARPLTWKPSDASNQHRDHLHIKGFDNRADVPPGFDPGMDVDVEIPDNGKGDPVIDPWDGKSLPDLDVFSSGFKHPANLLLQKRLVVHGQNPGELDSIFGPKTRAAVRAFQVANKWTGTNADGIPGPVTWERLMEDPTVPTKTHTVSVVSVSHLKKARHEDPPKSGTPLGSFANEVFTLETALFKTGYLKSANRVDGHYGSATVDAAKQFQRERSNDRSPDGWLGPRELQRLFELAKMSVKRID